MAIGTPTSLGTYIAATASNTGILTCAAAAPIGALVIVPVLVNGTGKTMGVTDSEGNTYSVPSGLTTSGVQQSGSPAQTVYLFTSVLTSALTTSDTITATCSTSTTTIIFAADYISGTTGLDGSAATNTGTSTSATPASAMTLGTGDLCYVIAGNGQGIAVSSYTTGISQEYLLQNTGSTANRGLYIGNGSISGSVTPGITWTTSHPWSLIAVALAPTTSTTTNITVSTSLASSPTLTRQAGRTLSTSLASAPSLSRQANRTLSAALTSTPVVVRQIPRAASAALLSLVTAKRQVGKVVPTISVSSSASLVRQVGHIVAAALTSTPTVARRAALTTATTVTSTPTVSRVVSKTITASQSLLASVNAGRAFSVTVTATVTSAVTVTKASVRGGLLLLRSRSRRGGDVVVTAIERLGSVLRGRELNRAVLRKSEGRVVPPDPT